MKIEWNAQKRRSNLVKHGIDFVELRELFDGYTLTFVDDRFEYDEIRFKTYGVCRDHVVVVIHTENEELIRVISARKANIYEQEIYFRALWN